MVDENKAIGAPKIVPQHYVDMAQRIFDREGIKDSIFVKDAAKKLNFIGFSSESNEKLPENELFFINEAINTKKDVNGQKDDKIDKDELAELLFKADTEGRTGSNPMEKRDRGDGNLTFLDFKAYQGKFDKAFLIKKLETTSLSDAEKSEAKKTISNSAFSAYPLNDKDGPIPANTSKSQNKDDMYNAGIMSQKAVKTLAQNEKVLGEKEGRNFFFGKLAKNGTVGPVEIIAEKSDDGSQAFMHNTFDQKVSQNNGNMNFQLLQRGEVNYQDKDGKVKPNDNSFKTTQEYKDANSKQSINPVFTAGVNDPDPNSFDKGKIDALSENLIKNVYTKENFKKLYDNLQFDDKDKLLKTIDSIVKDTAKVMNIDNKNFSVDISDDNGGLIGKTEDVMETNPIKKLFKPIAGYKFSLNSSEFKAIKSELEASGSSAEDIQKELTRFTMEMIGHELYHIKQRSNPEDKKLKQIVDANKYPLQNGDSKVLFGSATRYAQSPVEDSAYYLQEKLRAGIKNY